MSMTHYLKLIILLSLLFAIVQPDGNINQFTRNSRILQFRNMIKQSYSKSKIAPMFNFNQNTTKLSPATRTVIKRIYFKTLWPRKDPFSLNKLHSYPGAIDATLKKSNIKNNSLGNILPTENSIVEETMTTELNLKQDPLTTTQKPKTVMIMRNTDAIELSLFKNKLKNSDANKVVAQGNLSLSRKHTGIDKDARKYGVMPLPKNWQPPIKLKNVLSRRLAFEGLTRSKGWRDFIVSPILAASSLYDIYTVSEYKIKRLIMTVVHHKNSTRRPKKMIKRKKKYLRKMSVGYKPYAALYYERALTYHPYFMKKLAPKAVGVRNVRKQAFEYARYNIYSSKAMLRPKVNMSAFQNTAILSLQGFRYTGFWTIPFTKEHTGTFYGVRFKWQEVMMRICARLLYHNSTWLKSDVVKLETNRRLAPNKYVVQVMLIYPYAHVKLYDVLKRIKRDVRRLNFMVFGRANVELHMPYVHVDHVHTNLNPLYYRLKMHQLYTVGASKILRDTNVLLAQTFQRPVVIFGLTNIMIHVDQVDIGVKAPEKEYSNVSTDDLIACRKVFNTSKDLLKDLEGHRRRGDMHLHVVEKYPLKQKKNTSSTSTTDVQPITTQPQEPQPVIEDLVLDNSTNITINTKRLLARHHRRVLRRGHIMQANKTTPSVE